MAIVVLDTLRRDAFERQFDWLDGRRFENAVSTSHWTVPAHVSLFTGKYGSEVGVYAGARSLDCEIPVLPEQLRERGYTTHSLTANPNVSQQEGWDRGFDVVKGPFELQYELPDAEILDWDAALGEIDQAGPLVYPKVIWRCLIEDCDTIASLRSGFDLAFRKDALRRRDDGASAVLEWFRERDFDRSTFAFVNLMEAHIPYDPPEPYDVVGEPVAPTVVDAVRGVDDPERVRRAYDAAVQYLSDVYEDIHDQLMEKFDYVITVSDHGELLGEHGSWNHVVGLHPELIRVPLVVEGPDVKEGKDQTIVSLLDVHATVQDIAGLERSGRGRSLLSSPESSEVLTEYHDLMSGADEKLTTADVDPSTIDRLEEWRRGLVFSDGSYAYESCDTGTVQRVRDPPDDAPERIDEVASTVHQKRASNEIDRSVKRQLENLGYA